MKCRIFHDDCAILNAADDFRVIAARGMEKQMGLPFFESFLNDADSKSRILLFLNSEQSYCLIPHGQESLLFVSAWYESTKLVPVFLLHASERDVRQILNFASRDAFSTIFRVSNEPQNGEASLREQLAEIFYYLDGLTNTGHNFRTHCSMLASFFGCRVEEFSMPLWEEKMSDSLFHRVTAFLACSLLILRHRTGEIYSAGSFQSGIKQENVGKVQIEKKPTDTVLEIPAGIRLDTEFLLHVEQISNYEAEGKVKKGGSVVIPKEILALSKIPAFSDFYIEASDGTLAFEVRLDALDGLRAHALEEEIPWVRFSFRMAC